MLDGDAAIDAAFADFRQRVATVLLVIMAVGAVCALALYLPSMLAANAHGVVVLALVLVGTSVLMAAKPAWPLSLRVGWMVFNMWLAAVPGILAAGDRGVYATNFLGSVMTAALLLGWRAAAIMVLAVTGIFALAIWGHAVGTLPGPAAAKLDPLSTVGWVGLWLTMMEVAVLSVVGSTLLYNRLRGLIGELRRTVERRDATLDLLTRERTEREALSGVLDATLAAVRAGLWELDLVGGKLTCTGDMLRLLGVPAGTDEMSEEAFVARAHPDDRAELEAAMRTGRSELVFRAVLPDGTQRWLRATTSAKLDAEGAPERVRGLVVDVTAERAHELQRRRLAEVASRTVNPVVVSDLDGRIEWVNDAFTRLTGWGLDDVLSRRPEAFLHTEHTDAVASALIERAISRREPFEVEVVHRARDARQRWVRVESRVTYDDKGVPTGRVAVHTDITERRLAARRDSLAERVAALLLQADTVREAGEKLVQELVSELDVRTAQLWLAEPGKPHLAYVAGAASREAGEAGQVFLACTRALSFSSGRDFALGACVPGTAWGTGRTAALPVMAKVGSERLEPATAAGVSTFCAVPIRGPDGVLAVLEVGGTEFYPGHELLPTLLERVAEQVAAFLLHDASRRAFQQLFDQSPDGLLVVGDDGVVTDANARAASLFSEPVRRSIDALLEQGTSLVGEVLEGERKGRATSEAPLVRRSAVGARGEFAAEVSASSVAMATRRGAIIAIRDLTERYRMEAALTQSLREKDTLLREVHHRVKNNLQIVSSLLSLQAEGLEAGPSRDALLETVFRVRSMSFVHQQLYGTEDLDRIDFGAYARTLCTSLLGSLDPRARVTFEVEPVEVSIDVAVPCGLALNELVTNALKHGRSPDGTCSLRVELRREGEAVLLRVSDGGPGFPSGAVGATSLGMQLLRSLARQLSAKVEVSRDVGACVTLRMKRLLAPAREAGDRKSPIAPALPPG